MASSKRVFLSYAREDADFAGDLAGLLSRRGVAVFHDVDAITPGDAWQDVIRKGIEDASALVLLIPSMGGHGRNAVWFEAGAAKALGKPILAVLPPNRRATELPADIADILLLDADKRSLESVANILLQAVPESADAKIPAS